MATNTLIEEPTQHRVRVRKKACSDGVAEMANLKSNIASSITIASTSLQSTTKIGKEDAETVAALSASLAFRRFENGWNNHSAAAKIDDSPRLRESSDDSMRQLETILSKSGESGVSIHKLAGGSGSSTPNNKVSRRILGINNQEGGKNGINLRRSLQSNYSVSSGGDGSVHFRRSLQDEWGLQEDFDDDNSSDDNFLNSKECAANIEDEKESSMTVSLLESKQLTAEYSHLEGTTASSDSEDDEKGDGQKANMASILTLDLETIEDLKADDSSSVQKDRIHRLSANNIDATDDTAAEFMSSLQRIYHTFTPNEQQQQPRGKAQSSKPDASSKPEVTLDSLSLLLGKSPPKPQSTSNKSKQATVVPLQSSVAAMPMSNQHNNMQAWSNMLKRTSNAARMKSNDKITASNKIKSNNRIKSSFGSKLSLAGLIPKRNSTASEESKHNSSWINIIPPSSKGSQKEHAKGRSRVSWNLGDVEDSKLEEEIQRIEMRQTTLATTATLNKADYQDQRRSTGGESIDVKDLERVYQVPTQTQSPQESQSTRERRNSLDADEELLASMVHIAKHLGDSASTWGVGCGFSSGGENSASSDGAKQINALDMGVRNKKAFTAKRNSSIETNQSQNNGPADAANTMSTGTYQDTTNKLRDQQEQLGIVRQTSSSSTTTTSAAVTRLVYQEVEDYRTRLQRKRASMEIEEGYSGGELTRSDPPSSTASKDEELNELLLENATNISNALLLQRALYTLGIHNSEENRNRILGVTDEENNGIPPHGSSSSNDFASSPAMPRSHSEHTGINRMALNHLISLSGSGPKRNTPLGNSFTSQNGSNAQWEASFPSSLGAAAAPVTAFNNNSSNLRQNSLNRLRRFTYQEGADSEEAQTNNAASFQASRRASEVGAYHCNEPAPLLFARTFRQSAPNRRATREEARRNTLQALAISDAAEEAARATDLASRTYSCPATMFDNNPDMFASDASSGGSSDADSDPLDQGIDDQEENTRSHSIKTVRADNTTAEVPLAPIMDDSETDRDSIVSNSRRLAGSFRPSGITPAVTRRSRIESNFSSTTRSSIYSSTNTREGSLRVIDLEASHQSLLYNDTEASPGGNPDGASLREYLMASVRRQSFNSKRMLQAILVSDEIVEADPLHHSHHDLEIGQQEGLQARLVMMEELLEDNEEEQRETLERYEKRELIYKGLISLSVALIAVLIILILFGIGA